MEGSWNSAKWMGEDISNDVMEEGAGNILRYTLHTVENAPYYAYRAVAKLMEVVWTSLGNHMAWA